MAARHFKRMYVFVCQITLKKHSTGQRVVAENMHDGPLERTSANARKIYRISVEVRVAKVHSNS